MLPSPAIRILIVDDHPLMRQTLREICEGAGGIAIVAEAGDGAGAVALQRETRPDVILMDLVMPGMDGVEAIRRIVGERPEARVIALTAEAVEATRLGAIRAGARAYLVKTVGPSELVAAIRAVHRGEGLMLPVTAERQSLLPEERRILRLVARGMDNRTIAGALHLPVHAVANRLRTIYRKLRVTNRTQAAIYAFREGWTTRDEPSD